MDITIRFSNDEHIISIEKDLLDKHPNSMIYGYISSGFYNGEKLLLDNINYDDFKLVLEVIKGNIPSWDVSDEILSYIDKQGFELDPILTKYNDKLLHRYNYKCKCKFRKLNEKRNILYNFLYGKDIILEKNHLQKYSGNLFDSDKNIIHVNVVRYNNLPIIIYIYDIPIYCANVSPRKEIKEYLYKDMIDIVNIADVTLKMYKILFNKVVMVETKTYMSEMLEELEETYKYYKFNDNSQICFNHTPYNVNINDLFEKDINFNNLCEKIIKYFEASMMNNYYVGNVEYFVNVKNLLKID